MKSINAFIQKLQDNVIPFLFCTAGWAIVLRLKLYFEGSDFILDEINLARNLQEKGFLELASPLSYQQHAPILFTYVSKFIGQMGQYSEMSLRLLPLISGILGILLFSKILLQRKYGFFIVMVGIFLFSFNLVVLRYGLTYKQYSTDLLVALFLIYFHQKNHPILPYITLVFIGITVIFASMPSIFVLAWMVVSGYYNSRNKRYLLLGIIWAAIFGINYFVFLRPSIASDHLQSFHDTYFLTLPHDVESLRIFYDQIKMVFTGVFGKTIVALLLGIALFLWGWTRNIENTIFGIPIALVLIAAFLHKYSLLDRLILFAYPFIIILFLEGMKYVMANVNRLSAPWKYFFLLSIGGMIIVVLASPNRFMYWPTGKNFGMDGVSSGFQQWKSEANFDGCQVLSHNAAPFYHYYQGRRIVGEEVLPVLSWDHRELGTFKKDCDTLTIIDVHTFGSELKMLDSLIGQYGFLKVYESPDMRVIKVY